MDEFKVITIMNEAMLKLLKDKNENYERNLLIKEYLKDESIFFKIDKVKAYKILQTVGVNKEQLNKTYIKLTTQKMFYDLLNKGIIKSNDKNLVINYSKPSNTSIF